MHTAHCARNITLCQICKEPISKNLFDEHKKKCVAPKPKIRKPEPQPLTNFEKSEYYQQRKSIEDKKIAARKERQIQKYDRLVDSGYSLKTDSNGTRPPKTNGLGDKEVRNSAETKTVSEAKSLNFNGVSPTSTPPKPSSGLLACKFCDLELPKLELDDHENYCGSRTDKCLECGELVMFKYKQIHMDSNHGFLKLTDGKFGFYFCFLN